MFNLSFGEMLLLAAIGLIFIGPKQLPHLARILGRTVGELKKAIHEVREAVTTDIVHQSSDEKKDDKKESS